ARVSGPNDEIDVTEQVGPGRAANEPGASGLAVGAGTGVLLEVPRDAGPVDVQSGAMVDVLQMPPGRRAVLAAAADAEVRLGAEVEDKAAAGHEVAWPGKRGAAENQQPQRGDSNYITLPESTHRVLPPKFIVPIQSIHAAVLVARPHRLRGPTAIAGHCGGDSDIRNTGNDRVKRVHHHGSVGQDLLLVEHHHTARDGDLLVRRPAHVNGYTVDRKILDVRDRARAGGSRRTRARHDEVGADT